MIDEMPADPSEFISFAERDPRVPKAWKPSAVGIEPAPPVPSPEGEDIDPGAQRAQEANRRRYQRAIRRSLRLLDDRLSIVVKARIKTFLERYRRDLLQERDIDVAELAAELNLVIEILRGLGASRVPTYVARYSPALQFPENLLDAANFHEAVFQAAHSHLEPHAAPSTSPLEQDRIAIGRVLVLLVLRGGICESQLLQALYMSLGQPLRIMGDWRYIEITVHDGPLGLIEHRRIFLDNVAAAAYGALTLEVVRRYAEVSQQGAGARTRKPGSRVREEIYPCIRAFLAYAGVPPEVVPKWVALFLRQIAAAFRLRMPSLLVDFAERHVSSSSVSECIWARQLGYACPSIALPSDADDPESTEVQAREDKGSALALILDSQAVGQPDPLAPLRKAIKGDRTKALEMVKQLLSDPTAFTSPLPICRSLAEWTLHLLTTPLATGRPRATSTVGLALRLLSNRLIAAVGSRAVSDVAPEDWAEIYGDLVEGAVSARHRLRLVQHCRTFEIFLSESLGRPAAEWSVSGAEGLASSVSANFVTQREYSAIQKAIEAPDSPFDGAEERRDASVVAALGYRLGIRIDEGLGLLVSDVQLGPNGCVLIRENRLRRLKSPNSRRVLPLALLTAPELKLLEEVVASRPRGDIPLLAKPGSVNPYADHQIVPKLKTCLERATGDKTLHFHHLRHSCATTILFALMCIPAHPGIGEIVVDVLGLSREDISRIQAGLLRGLRTRSGKAWVVTHVLGHSYPYTSMRHYVHCLDLLLFLHLCEINKATAVDVLAAAGYEKGTRIRHNDFLPMFRRLDRQDADRILLVAPLLAPKEGALAQAGGGEPRSGITYADLMSLPKTSMAAGTKIPSGPDERRQAVVTLGHLNRCFGHAPDALTAALRKWDDAFLPEKAVASLKLPDLKVVWDGLALGDDGSPLAWDVERVVYVNKVRRTQTVAPAEVRKLLGKSTSVTGRFWLCLSTREASVERKRVKSRRAVAWTLSQYESAVRRTPTDNNKSATAQ